MTAIPTCWPVSSPRAPREADAVCFSCPVYYYSVCGQMKVFLDRMNPLYDKMKDKDFYYMVTAQDDNRRQLDRAFDV